MAVRTHVQVGFANPFLICEECRASVRYWHNSERCGCDGEYFNYPCKHKADVISRCPTWGPVDGCSCETQCIK